MVFPVRGAALLLTGLVLGLGGFPRGGRTYS